MDLVQREQQVTASRGEECTAASKPRLGTGFPEEQPGRLLVFLRVAFDVVNTLMAFVGQVSRSRLGDVDADSMAGWRPTSTAIRDESVTSVFRRYLRRSESRRLE